MYRWKLYHLIFRLTRLASQPSHPQVMAGEHKKLTEKYQQAKQEIQYSQTTLARVEMDMEKTKQELREAQIKNERSNQSQRVHEVRRLEKADIVQIHSRWQTVPARGRQVPVRA